MKHVLLSVVIPAYNEAKRIGATLSDLKRYFDGRDVSHEVIVVDDGSTDGTADIVRGFSKEFPTLRVIENGRNRGKGYSVRAGMLAAAGAYRLFMDADNSVTIRSIEPFIEEIYRGGHDIIIGSIAFSYMPPIEHNGWHRRLFGSISKFLVRIVATPGIYDTQRGFKLFTKRAAETVFPLQRIERFGFDIEILAIAQLHRLSIKELPVYWDNPAGSKVHLRAYLESFVELGRIYASILRGAYDPPKARGVRRAKASVALLFVTEFPALAGRLVKEILSSKIHLDIKIFDRETERRKGKGLVYRGKEFVHYASLDHRETALYTVVKAQKVFALLAAIAFASALFIDWQATLLIAISGAAVAYVADLAFHSYLIARSLRKKPALKFDGSEKLAMSERGLPTYTVLCPLYREWFITPQFLAALENIDYPTDRLEVILLLEERDTRTRKAIDSLLLPDHFKKLVVPYSKPRTRARAINYGLEHAQGEYLVVYGAGDMPEPDQLKKALLAFERSGPLTVSVQAKVGFYNTDESVLTRIFAAEHALWFDMTLPGLQSIRAPMPLAGTSNHFKTEALRQLGGWDSFNVSEDWDLGIRLSKKGFRTAVVESTTLEEANPSIRDWHIQRSRWVKGYIQTYLVHMRDPHAFRGGARQFLAFQVVVGAKIFALLANPLFWLLAATYISSKTQIGLPIERLFPPLAALVGASAFALGNLIYLATFLVACTKRSLRKLAGYAPFVPLYRLGMSGAAWKALADLAIDPHRSPKPAPKKRKIEDVKGKEAPERKEERTKPVLDLT